MLLIVLGVIAVAVVMLVLFGIGLYNGLIRIKILVDEAWSGIDVQLKRRYDLIPNLIETVKGYAKHEQKTFERVTELRTAAMSAQGVEQKAEIENQLSQTLKTLFAVAENYPELKANQNFIELQTTLKQIEEEIQGARRYYNGTVRDYNTKIQVFPNNIFAGMLGFTSREFFEAAEAEKENVKVDFSDLGTKN